MSLLKLFISICLLKKGPEDIPASPVLLKMVVAFYLAVSTLLYWVQNGAWLNGVIHAVAEFLVAWGAVGALLWVSGFANRFLQTMIGLLGCDALIALVAIPIISLSDGSALILVLIGWSIAITGHVFRRSLSHSLSFGVGVALLYNFLSYQIIVSLFD